ncbi:PspC domain-containing protein [Pseudoduganella umbonata]|uniref:Phage shock protein PspC (Stress-responsive transcriptional regulator) n=1 Tax=Pseudoduganella umbonata TaxID=864828 RepID=A0A4P8HRD6_9BURK|nr:PspC domain-containing protein [Pseudoduganella umbonata]MBB3224871.1 phage shock protein PspC (stress-responsive transcriptional regulator) [Pseudoduganella umbonata]QCP11172.1 PspC domain-containing protein [Pseudoduganella umbonata]
MTISDEIRRLHELHQAGALTDAEFARAKERLLNGVPGQAAGAGNGDLASEFSQLRRSRADRWLGGVCGGLGRASGVDAWIWRLVFVLFTISFGFGLVIYILLWIFVPEEAALPGDDIIRK